MRGKIPDNAEQSYFIHMTENQTDIRGIGKSEYIWNTTWEFGANLKQDLPSINIVMGCIYQSISFHKEVYCAVK